MCRLHQDRNSNFEETNIQQMYVLSVTSCHTAVTYESYTVSICPKITRSMFLEGTSVSKNAIYKNEALSIHFVLHVLRSGHD
jgi:hypothetical protein